MAMNHEWISRAMSRRQASYGHGGRDRMIASFWSALKGMLESQLRHYRAACPAARVELEATKDKIVIVGADLMVMLKADGSIEVSTSIGNVTEHVFLPMTPQAVDKLAQRILEPALFPDQVVTVVFREAFAAKTA